MFGILVYCPRGPGWDLCSVRIIWILLSTSRWRPSLSLPDAFLDRPCADFTSFFRRLWRMREITAGPSSLCIGSVACAPMARGLGTALVTPRPCFDVVMLDQKSLSHCCRSSMRHQRRTLTPAGPCLHARQAQAARGGDAAPCDRAICIQHGSHAHLGPVVWAWTTTTDCWAQVPPMAKVRMNLLQHRQFH
ncbi:hypothetical protein BV20DRAFT_432946 [Pilatotrama ljubarskyi]|nr:hypothetical protein BV20DRAFT_432946 [Pilatotrama ljubarskyi]